MEASNKAINHFLGNVTARHINKSTGAFSIPQAVLIDKPSDKSSKTGMNEPEEKVWWNEFKNGSELAFSLIYKKYIFSLYNYGERITLDKELIEDSIHDLFVDLWRNRDSIGQANSIKFYLYKGLKRKIIKNLIIKRKLPSNKNISQDYDFEIIFPREVELIANQVSIEQKERLLKAISKLTKRQKEAITLKFYDGLTYQEIASILSISVKSTYTHIYRAIDVLKGIVQ